MNSLRDQMPALHNKTYFNYGGQGPLPQDSLAAITSSWEKIQELGPFTNSIWPYIASENNFTKQELTKACGASIKRIALTENVTSGCVLPLWGLPFNTGDRILISDCEHPGVVAACIEIAKRKGLEIDILNIQNLHINLSNKVDVKDTIFVILEKALQKKTRLVVISHVLWNTGAIMPVEAISLRLSNHPNKPFLLVDGAQSFGQLPIQKDVNSSDIYAFTGHKWACGPEGLGGVVLSERVLNEARPTLVGWKSLKNENILDTDNINLFHQDSRKFEIATSCIPLLAGLRCSLNLLDLEGNIEQRFKTIQGYSEELWSKLSLLNHVDMILQKPPSSGLISFKIQSTLSPKEIVSKLGNESIWIRALESPDCLRACVHITTTKEEINRLIYELESLLNK